MEDVNDIRALEQHVGSKNVIANTNINFDITLPCFQESFPFQKEYTFENCIFNNKVTFLTKTIKDKDTFTKYEYNDVSFYFKNCQFQEVNCKDVIFKRKIRFHECLFHKKIIFNNPSFHELVDFWSSTFKERVIFYKANFGSVVVLSSAIFQENVLFTYSRIEKVFILRGATFEKGLDLALAIILGDVIAFDLYLNDFKAIKEPKKPKKPKKPEKPTSDWSKSYDGIIAEKGDIFISNKRETFRIIKNQLIQQNNIIDSTEFYYLENKALSEEKASRVFKLSFDGMMLFLNRISNRHRTSYVRGILFTLISGILFYYLSVINSSKYIIAFNINCDIIQDNISGYFSFIIPTHTFDYLGKDFVKQYVEKSNYWFYIFDFIGRIFVGYGIYQTIQAFRKYK